MYATIHTYFRCKGVEKIQFLILFLMKQTNQHFLFFKKSLLVVYKEKVYTVV